MKKITLKKVNRQNVEAVLNLEVKEEQKKYVANPCKSLAYAYANKEITEAFGIYFGNQLVGYTSIIFEEEENVFNLWHFFIDQKFQGKGLGKKSLTVIMDDLKRKAKGITNKVALGVEADNSIAIKLYKSFGFLDTGEKDDDGEIIMLYEY